VIGRNSRASLLIAHVSHRPAAGESRHPLPSARFGFGPLQHLQSIAICMTCGSRHLPSEIQINASRPSSAAVRVGIGSCAMRIAVQGGIWMEIDEGTDAGWVAGVVRALAVQAS